MRENPQGAFKGKKTQTPPSSKQNKTPQNPPTQNPLIFKY